MLFMECQSLREEACWASLYILWGFFKKTSLFPKLPPHFLTKLKILHLIKLYLHVQHFESSKQKLCSVKSWFPINNLEQYNPTQFIGTLAICVWECKLDLKISRNTVLMNFITKLLALQFKKPWHFLRGNDQPHIKLFFIIFILRIGPIQLQTGCSTSKDSMLHGPGMLRCSSPASPWPKALCRCICQTEVQGLCHSLSQSQDIQLLTASPDLPGYLHVALQPWIKAHRFLLPDRL